jgi:hypothetical protein
MDVVPNGRCRELAISKVVAPIVHRNVVARRQRCRFWCSYRPAGRSLRALNTKRGVAPENSDSSNPRASVRLLSIPRQETEFVRPARKLPLRVSGTDVRDKPDSRRQFG